MFRQAFAFCFTAKCRDRNYLHEFLLTKVLFFIFAFDLTPLP